MIDFSIRQLFPAFLLADRNGYAMARAIEAGLKYFLERAAAGLGEVLDYDEMDQWRLDELAWELNVPWYDPEATLEEKRQTIKDAAGIYERLGTPEAVLRAINGVFGSGRVEEWWQYGGDAYHFRVYTTNSSAIEENYARFMKIVNAVRNVRSVLDGVYYVGDDGTATLWPMAGAAAAAGKAQGTAVNYGA